MRDPEWDWTVLGDTADISDGESVHGRTCVAGCMSSHQDLDTFLETCRRLTRSRNVSEHSEGDRRLVSDTEAGRMRLLRLSVGEGGGCTGVRMHNSWRARDTSGDALRGGVRQQTVQRAYSSCSHQSPSREFASDAASCARTTSTYAGAGAFRVLDCTVNRAGCGVDVKRAEGLRRRGKQTVGQHSRDAGCEHMILLWRERVP